MVTLSRGLNYLGPDRVPVLVILSILPVLPPPLTINLLVRLLGAQLTQRSNPVFQLAVSDPLLLLLHLFRSETLFSVKKHSVFILIRELRVVRDIRCDSPLYRLDKSNVVLDLFTCVIRTKLNPLL